MKWFKRKKRLRFPFGIPRVFEPPEDIPHWVSTSHWELPDDPFDPTAWGIDYYGREHG